MIGMPRKEVGRLRRLQIQFTHVVCSIFQRNIRDQNGSAMLSYCSWFNFTAGASGTPAFYYPEDPCVVQFTYIWRKLFLLSQWTLKKKFELYFPY